MGTDPPFVCFHYLSNLAFCQRVREGFERRWRECGAIEVYPSPDFNEQVLQQPHCLGWAGFLGTPRMRAAARDSVCPAINYSNREGPCAGALNVFPDETEVARVAADRLLAKGYRRFVCIGVEGHGYSHDREEGFAACLQEKGFTVQRFAFDNAEAENPVRFSRRRLAQVRAWLGQLQLPAGILVTNDFHAIVFLALVRQINPDSLPLLGVVGVDNDPLNPGILPPLPVSSVEPNWTGVGEAIADELLAAIAGKPLARGAVRRVPGAGWIERESTGGFSCDDALVARVARQIQREIAAGTAPRVEALARQSGITRRTLLARFSAASGQTLRDYLLAERLRRAALLLRETDQSIADVAYACGFGKHAELSQHFKRAHGLTPRDFRQQARA